jgi:hypothetical protein
MQDSGQGSYYQYKNLSNAALRTLSRLIKLDLLGYALLNSKSTIAEMFSLNPSDSPMIGLLQD